MPESQRPAALPACIDPFGLFGPAGLPPEQLQPLSKQNALALFEQRDLCRLFRNALQAHGSRALLLKYLKSHTATALLQLPNLRATLRVLDLANMKLSDAENTARPLRDVHFLHGHPDYPNVRVARLSGVHFSSEGLRRLPSALPKLESLELTGCTGVADPKDISNLTSGRSRLAHLDIRGCSAEKDIDAAWIQTLFSSSDLVALHTTRAQDPKVAEALRSCPRLYVNEETGYVTRVPVFPAAEPEEDGYEAALFGDSKRFKTLWEQGFETQQHSTTPDLRRPFVHHHWYGTLLPEANQARLMRMLWAFPDYTLVLHTDMSPEAELQDPSQGVFWRWCADMKAMFGPRFRLLNTRDLDKHVFGKYIPPLRPEIRMAAERQLWGVVGDAEKIKTALLYGGLVVDSDLTAESNGSLLFADLDISLAQIQMDEGADVWKDLGQKHTHDHIANDVIWAVPDVPEVAAMLRNLLAELRYAMGNPVTPLHKQSRRHTTLLRTFLPTTTALRDRILEANNPRFAILPHAACHYAPPFSNRNWTLLRTHDSAILFSNAYGNTWEAPAKPRTKGLGFRLKPRQDDPQFAEKLLVTKVLAAIADGLSPQPILRREGLGHWLCSGTTQREMAGLCPWTPQQCLSIATMLASHAPDHFRTSVATVV